jgi:hypothetical protein
MSQLKNDFDDEELTQPIPVRTLDEVAAEWRASLNTIPTCDRPTRDIRPPSCARSRATTEVMP